MQNINITNFLKNVYPLLNQAIKYNEPINIRTKIGNVVILSKEDYDNFMETIYLSTPVMEKIIVKGVGTPIAECLSANEVKW